MEEPIIKSWWIAPNKHDTNNSGLPATKPQFLVAKNSKISMKKNAIFFGKRADFS